MGRYNKDTEIANGPIKYEIQVITSNAEHAGTDDNVFIEIVGTKGRTGKRPLKVGKFRDGFERGQERVHFCRSLLPDEANTHFSNFRLITNSVI